MGWEKAQLHTTYDYSRYHANVLHALDTQFSDFCRVVIQGGGDEGATKSLYFGTYTRVGIDASSDGTGIGAKNVALNITPPKKDGSAFDVLGTSDMDLAYSKVVIKEIVAVGDAAKCAAMKNKASGGPTAEKILASASSAQSAAVGPVIFGAYTSWSLIDLS